MTPATQKDIEKINKNNPFPGLRAFETKMDDGPKVFFGRDREVDIGWEKLSRTHFLTILGPSGSGKTSLIQAGLIPKLESGKFVGRGGDKWRFARCIPHENPIKSLVEALQEPGALAPRVLPETNVGTDIETHLRKNSQGLINAYLDSDMVALERDREVILKENLLVVVDQFENIFKEDSTGAQSVDAISFVNLLVTASKAHHLPIYIVLGFQSDFIGNITEFSGLTEAIMEGRLVMPAMNDAQLRQAIEGPVRAHRAQINPRLVNEIIDDLNDPSLQTGEKLPALQYLMRKTWSQWAKDLDTHKRLELQGVDRVSLYSLEEQLDALFDSLNSLENTAYRAEFPERNQWICQSMFQAITEKRGENQYLSRRKQMSIDELALIAGVPPEDMIKVVKVFTKPEHNFLVSSTAIDIFPESYIAIAHPFIIKKWRKLQKWMDEEQEDGIIYKRLLESANKKWRDEFGKPKPNMLLYDPDLSLTWRTMFPDLVDEKGRDVYNTHYQNCSYEKIKNEGYGRPTASWALRYASESQATENINTLQSLGEHDHKEFHNAIAYLKASKSADCRAKSTDERKVLKRRRRDRILMVIFGILTLGALILLGLAINQVIKASVSSYEAELARMESIRTAIEADSLRIMALKAQRLADENFKEAQRNFLKLDTAQDRLVLATQAAIESKRKAQENYEWALANAYRAEISAEKARKNAREADENARIADRNAEKARYLSKLGQAQALAANAQRQLNDPALQALLAVEAHSLNQHESCESKDFVYNELNPNIYAALNHALEILETDDYNTVMIKRTKELGYNYLHRGVIRGMAYNPKVADPQTTKDSASRDFLYTSSGDGKIFEVVPNELKYFSLRIGIDSLRKLQMEQVSPKPIAGPFNGNKLLPLKLFKVMAMSSNKQWMALGGNMSSIYMVSVENPGGDSRKIETHIGQGVLDITSFRFGNEQGSDKHMGFLSSGADKQIAYINWKTEKPRPTYLFQTEDTVLSLSYNEREGILAGGTSGGGIYLWKLIDTTASGRDGLSVRLIKRIKQEEGNSAITAISFGRDANTIATGHRNGMIQIWDMKNETYRRQPNHSSYVTDLHFSPDFRYLASASYDRSVLVYSLSKQDEDKTGMDYFTTEPLRLSGKSRKDPLPWATALAFDTDASNLFVGYRNGIIKKWSLEPQKMSSRIMKHLIDNQMTTCIKSSNWDRYLGQNQFYCDPENQTVSKCR